MYALRNVKTGKFGYYYGYEYHVHELNEFPEKDGILLASKCMKALPTSRLLESKGLETGARKILHHVVK